jgi:hypothetical protein
MTNGASSGTSGNRGAGLMKTLTLDGRALEAVAGHLDESLRLIESRFLVRVAAAGLRRPLSSIQVVFRLGRLSYLESDTAVTAGPLS